MNRDHQTTIAASLSAQARHRSNFFPGPTRRPARSGQLLRMFGSAILVAIIVSVLVALALQFFGVLKP